MKMSAKFYLMIYTFQRHFLNVTEIPCVIWAWERIACIFSECWGFGWNLLKLKSNYGRVKLKHMHQTIWHYNLKPISRIKKDISSVQMDLLFVQFCILYYFPFSENFSENMHVIVEHVLEKKRKSFPKILSRTRSFWLC